MPSSPRTNWRRRIAVASLTLLTTAGLALVAPAEAQAWPWDPHVGLAGFANCDTGTMAHDGTASAIWVWDARSGEIAQAPVNAFGYFVVRVSHVPPQGTYLSIWLYCALPGLEPGWRYAGDDFIERQLAGTETTLNWFRA